MTGPQIPPPFLVLDFLILTRLNSYLRESGRLPRFEQSFKAGFVKMSSQGRSKFPPNTLPDTFSDDNMLFELNRKGVSSFPRTFRIEAKPFI